MFDNEGKPRTLQLAVPPAWMTDQELPCHGRISDYFDTRGKSSAQLASLCAGCPVVEQCLQFALDMEGNAAANLRYGVYGGTTPSQRYAISKGLDMLTTVEGKTA